MKKEYKTPDLILGYLNKKDLKILYINPPIKNDLQAQTSRLEPTNSRNRSVFQLRKITKRAD